jgi:tetratricopeptide (TPR) repeat protein
MKNMMKIKKILIFFLVLLISKQIYPQKSESFVKKFTDANYHIEYGNYDLALPIFLELLANDPDNANLNYKVGLCYLKGVKNRKASIPYLEKATQNISKNYDDLNPYEKKAPNITYLYLGQALHIAYRFDEAIEVLEKFKSTINKKHVRYAEAERTIAMCNNAKEFIATPNQAIIRNLGDAINTEFPEYSPVISIDESTLIFTSRRSNTTGGTQEINGEWFEDIYISQKDSNDNWTAAKQIGSNINTPDHEASIGLSADGQKLFIYKGEEGGSIWMSELVGEEWSVPMKLGSDINTEYWETHAVISADERFLYFVSNRPGGYGGRDIWMCKKLPNGMWGLAQNLGPKINTPYDEDAPFIHPDGKQIFFSSNGHKTMGGFDIFFSELLEDGTWTEPTNLRHPINTTEDDIYYVTSADGKRAYLSSFRDGGKGEKDIYLVTIPEAVEKAITVLVGYIKISDGSPISPDTRVTVLNIETGELLPFKPNISTGKYVLTLTPGNYKISYEMNGNEFHTEDIYVPAESSYNLINKELLLDPVTFMVKGKDAEKTPMLSPQTTPEYVEIKGRILMGQKEKTPLANHKVYLRDQKDLIIAETETDAEGNFRFEKIDKKQKHVLELARDPKLDTAPIYLFKISGTLMGPFVKNNKGIYRYELLPLIVDKMITEDEQDIASITKPKEKQEVKEKEVKDKVVKQKEVKATKEDIKTTGIAAGSYIYYFGYNIKNIDTQKDDFIQFADSILRIINSGGLALISIESSASRVPTSKFKNNLDLSKQRAKTSREILENYLKEKGANMDKIKFTITSTLVQGPQYNNDPQNHKKYYPYQYVKFTVKQ